MSCCERRLRPDLRAAIVGKHRERRKRQRWISKISVELSPKSSTDFYPKLHLQEGLKKIKKLSRNSIWEFRALNQRWQQPQGVERKVEFILAKVGWLW